MSFTITGVQNLVKNCYAYAEDLDIALISNGEQPVQILTSSGISGNAGIRRPANSPILVNDIAGNLTDLTYAAYVYVYVIKDKLHGVSALNDGNGSFAPRSNPSPHGINQVTGGNKQVTVTMERSTNALVTHIWVYRTTLVASSGLANTNALAGSMYWIGEVANPVSGSAVYTDNTVVNSANGLIELFNFEAPQFKFSVYDGSYFWGFGNQPFITNASWAADGTITLTDFPSIKFWLGGRNRQFITFSTVTTGGINGKGLFYFKQLTPSTGYVYTNTANEIQTTLPALGSGKITIQGEGATLYRSAYKNPMSWGHVTNIAGVFVPILWTLRVAGSTGTALALVPDQELLKLDMEFPALCVTFNLQSAATDTFANSRQTVSKLYSVTCHHSQFPAVYQGRNVLWGMDFKSNSILQFDGANQAPISTAIPDLLRDLTTNRRLQMLSHGCYDPYTELNCIWLTSNAPGVFKIDRCIYYHWPSNSWGMAKDYDILSSVSVEDINTSQRKTYVGTETGYFGRAFDPTTNGNWLPSTTKSGTITATGTNILTTTPGSFGLVNGYDGNYVIIVTPNQLQVVVRKIVSHNDQTLSLASDYDRGIFVVGSKFFIGQITLSVVKYISGQQPNEDKTLQEAWLTIQDVDAALLPVLRFYFEQSETPIKIIPLQRDNQTDAYFAKINFPQTQNKVIGIELIDRSYNAVKFSNITLTFK